MCTPRFLIVTTVTVTVGRDLLLYKAVVPTGDGDVLADEHLRVALLSLRQCLDERVVRIAAEEFVDDSLRVAAQHALIVPSSLHRVHTRTDPVCTQKPYLTAWFEPLAAWVLELCTRDFRPQRCVKQGVFGLKHVFTRL